MKSHTFKMNLCVHNVSIHVSFPCTVGASLQIDNQEFQITDNIDIKQAQVLVNAPIQTDVSLLYNPRTKVYSMKKAVVNFFLRTKSGKLQAGSTAIFLNKSIQGCIKETAPINKCSDRQANFQYSLVLDFIEQTETNMSASMLKGSQISENMRNSSVSFGNKLFENSHLYESIVQEVDEKTDRDWDKVSVGSKENSCIFVADLKQTQSSKALNSGWRNQQEGNGFRKSRIQGSVEQVRRYQSNSAYQGKLSASKAQFQQQEEDRKLLSQKKINELEKQNREMKEALNTIRERFEQQILHEKTSLRKSQIQQTSLREELDMMKQKFGNLEQQTKKMMFEKNEILNKYNTKQAETISQVKAREKTLTLENKRFAQKSEKLQKQLTEQQDKYRQLDSKFRQQEISLSKNKKQIEYYQQEAMQLDEKVSQLKLVEQKLNNEIEKLKEELSKRQVNYEKEMQKYKKDLNNIKEFKENQSKGLGQELTSLRNQIKEKEGEINTLKKDFETQKRRFGQQQSSLRQQKEKLQKELKVLKQERIQSQESEYELLFKIKELDQKVSFLQQEMQNIINSRDEVLGEMQHKLEELNLQEFRLNEQNFELQEKIAILENQLKEKEYAQKNLIEDMQIVKKELSSKEQELQRVHAEFQKTLQASSTFGVQLRELKKQLVKKDQIIKALQTKLQTIEALLVQEMNQNHELQVSSKLKINEKDEIIHELNDKITELEIVIQQKDVSYHTANSEICSLHESISTLEKQTLQLQTQKDSLLKNFEQVTHNLAQSHEKIDRLSKQIQKANEQIAIGSKKSQTFLQNESSLMQFVSLFQTTFSSILAKDYQSVALTSPRPIQNYKYAQNNIRKSFKSFSAAKKNTVQQTNEIKKLALYSQKNVQFASSFSLKLQQLEAYLIKIHTKLFQTEKSLQNQTAEKTKYQLAKEKTAQEINELQNTIRELYQEIKNLNKSLTGQNKTIQNLKSENLKALNETKRQNLQVKKQLAQLKKQMEKKNLESTKATNIQSDLNKKIQALSSQSKENLQKFQKSNQELSGKNQQINEFQTTIRDKVAEISKLKARIVELQQELSKTQKEKDDFNKSLVIQQQQNSKNLLTVKEQKQLLLKKEESLKQVQKQLKLLEGQLFNQKRFKPQQSIADDSQNSISISSYSTKKFDIKKQPEFTSPTSTFSYRKIYTSNKKISQTQSQSQSDQITKSEIQSLKQNISQKQKLIDQLQEKLKSIKISPGPFSKNTSVTVEPSISKDELIMRQKILENLQAIQSILSSQETGGRFDKYKLQLSSLINKNKKIISDGSPFEQMRKICMLIQKAKTNVQNKLKLENEVKTVIIDEFMKIQAIVDEVMGK